ncbi:DUF411 domain-containing protein [Aquisalimonas asiatica]|uniref:Uncharacterized conserved protein n=1 Tax=Aquisalimonas asiatica TaxID=406100 RepID=A0A1H8S5J4_9GAMM|nr:DUF411 domain-containing protein [Aquisalimonas asiatica]SEO73960.1 Uncharacterized conserved protein [Aquisalimonas asiatica]
MNHHTLRRLAVTAVLMLPGAALATTATVHKTPTCGCCDVYVEYLEDQGFDVEVVDHDTMNPIFRELGIDRTMASCHTVDIGPYTVIGHMPAEVIEQLLDERPPIRGITLPGMPVGSPGMPGEQQEPWTVYRITAADSEPQVYTQY